MVHASLNSSPSSHPLPPPKRARSNRKARAAMSQWQILSHLKKSRSFKPCSVTKLTNLSPSNQNKFIEFGSQRRLRKKLLSRLKSKSTRRIRQKQNKSKQPIWQRTPKMNWWCSQTRKTTRSTLTMKILQTMSVVWSMSFGEQETGWCYKIRVYLDF